MRPHKPLLIIIVALLLPSLCGCGSLAAKRLDPEQIRVMQTMGLDAAPGGVLLSLGAAAGVKEADAPVCLSAAGRSVSDAMDRMRQHAPEETLFCGHLRHMLIGGDLARQDLAPVLAYICRSSDARLDMPLYLVDNATAREAMTRTGGNDKSVSQLLDAIRNNDELSRLLTASHILRSLSRHGGALMYSLTLTRSAEDESTGAAETGGLILAPSGLAVLRGDRFCRQLAPEDSLGAALLLGVVTPQPLVLEDGDGRAVTLEISGGSARATPLWDETGRLEGIAVEAQLRAAVLEDGGASLADPERSAALTAGLEAAVSRRLLSVLQLEKELGCDFLGLGEQIEAAAPLAYRRSGGALGPLLPDLALQVTVRAELDHSNDLN